MNLLSTGIAYSDALAKKLSKKTKIGNRQSPKDSDINVMTNEKSMLARAIL